MIEVGPLRLDPATRQAWRGDTEIGLSAREYALLETFMRRAGLVLSQELYPGVVDEGLREGGGVPSRIAKI